MIVTHSILKSITYALVFELLCILNEFDVKKSNAIVEYSYPNEWCVKVIGP